LIIFTIISFNINQNKTPVSLIDQEKATSNLSTNQNEIYHESTKNEVELVQYRYLLIVILVALLIMSNILQHHLSLRGYLVI
jgi:hypothetical protein